MEPIARVNRTGDRFEITGGTRSGDGRNLFHSFQDFNLEAGQVANFVSDSRIQNILGRINGGNASVIDGLLKVSGGQSNLFLLNPSGIVFGKNATLDVPAAFTATTANGIQFGKGWFGATGTDDLQALNGAPVGFAFSSAQPGAIVNLGNLTVWSGQNLTVLGGTVASTGSLAAPDGQVTVTAVPGTSYVRLSQAGQFLSLEVQPLSTSAILPNAGSLSVVSLPQLLTGAGADSATGLTVNPDGTVQLTGSSVAVAQGDVTVKALNAGTATLSAANTLSLVESQITTAKDLTLLSQGTVTVQDSQTSPVAVQAGGNLTVTGDRGIDIATINAFTTAALQSGGNLNLSSDGLITVNASLSGGSDLSFLNLTGGTGNLFNGNQTILELKGVVNLGNYTGVSLKVEAAGSIRGGDITITGPKKNGVDKDDPDYFTLKGHPALILRAGLSEPASIISVGNVTAHGGIVDFSTNGNIFTGNIDVSTNDPANRTSQKRITLKAHNIFTGNLNAGSDIAPGTTIPIECYLSDVPIDGTCSDSMEIHDPAGSISLDATQYLRTGNIDASSRTANGGNVTIQASDAIVGSINTSGSTNTVHRRRSDFYGNLVDYYHSFNGGDVSVKADTFKVGTISTDGGQKKGTVTIDAPPSVPIPDSGNNSGAGSGQAGSGSTQTHTADGASGGLSGPIGSNALPPDDTNNSDDLPSDGGTLTGTSAQTNFADLPASLFIPDLRASFSTQDDFVKDSFEETQSQDGLDSPEAVRKRVLTFLEARRLAGEKWTAQAISQKLDIPLEIAQIAVLNAIGRNIKVEIPDVSDLYQGTFLAGDSDIFPFDGIKAVGNGFYAVVVFGVTIATLPFIKAYELWQHFLSSQRGRGNQADKGVFDEANERIQEGTAANMEDALNQLMKEARQANNGKGDQEQIAKIRKTQKATQNRPSRETKDKKKK